MALGLYVLQANEAEDDEVLQNFRLIGPFINTGVAEAWVDTHLYGVGQLIEWNPDLPVDIVSPEAVFEELYAACARCPQCGQRAHAFNHVSEPVGPADGAYATCADCKIYWPFSNRWWKPDEMDLTAARRFTYVVRNVCELVRPPEAVITMNKEKGTSLPGVA